jgi:antirestriction protein ArdC
MSDSGATPKRDLRQDITDAMIAALEKGTLHGKGHGAPNLTTHSQIDHPICESQYEYLERLNLLKEAEKRHFEEEDQKENVDRGKQERQERLIKFRKSKKEKIKTRSS